MSDPFTPLASVEFELTPEEWAAAAAEHLYDTETHRGQRRAWRVLVGTSFGLLAAMGLWMFGLPIALASLAVGATLIATTPALFKRTLLTHLTRTARGGVQNGLFGPHRVELRAEGLCDITPSYETLWRWGSIDGVSDLAGVFMVKVGPIECLPIPHTAFRDADVARQFADTFYARSLKARRDRADALSPPS